MPAVWKLVASVRLSTLTPELLYTASDVQEEVSINICMNGLLK